ncbi:MAG: hypothetical protein IJ573_07610 [Clostridia bacterium]|nr:hypothetical protein [Clostridia bacterium]
MAKTMIDREKMKRGEEVLRSLKSLKKLAEAEREEAARLREMAKGSSFSWAGERRGRDAERRLLEAEERWAQDAQRLARQEAQAARAMEKMDARECLLLHLRWLRGCTWEGVGMRLYVCERTARRMHGAALCHFAEAYENCGREEHECGADNLKPAS